MAAKPLLIYSILLIEKILLIKNLGDIYLSHKWASLIDKIKLFQYFKFFLFRLRHIG